MGNKPTRIRVAVADLVRPICGDEPPSIIYHHEIWESRWAIDATAPPGAT
jgi:hypothetical protein